MKTLSIFAIILVALCAYVNAGPQNVIFYIGDGMGFEQVEAAELFTGTTMFFNDTSIFLNTADCTTYPANGTGTVTDSASAGTALATGVKVYNGVISIASPGDGSELLTLLEDAQIQGKSVGLITTAYLTHATPAAFGAHESNRNNYTQIGDDLLTQTLPNVLFGGGGNGLTPADTTDAGYTVVTDLSGFNALSTTLSYASAQFGTYYMDYKLSSYDPGSTSNPTYPYPSSVTYPNYGYPLLDEMTTKAIEILSKNPKGFFLMVEGGRVDHACHANSITDCVHEVIDFSNAVEAGYNWAQNNAISNTLILVTADHETGGLTIVKDNGVGQYPSATWSTTGHTGANVPVYAWGMNAELVYDTMDNTQMWDVVLTDLDVDPPVISNINVSPGENSAVITWDTDEDATSVVDYGLDTDFGSQVSDASLVTSHNVTLTTLLPDTTYHYQVTSVDASGNDSVTVDDFTFTTLPGNNPPEATQDISAFVLENGSVVIELSGTDPDTGDILTFSISSPPANGTLNTDNINITNEVVYAPEPDYSGPDQFEFEVSDGKAADTATVSITVYPGIDAVDDSFTVDEDSQDITLDVLANDPAAAGAEKTIDSFDPPANGTIVINLDNNTLTYTPDPDFEGTDTFTYTARATQTGVSGDNTDSATVTITVNGINDLPVAADDTAVTDEDISVVISVLGNDSDPVENSALTVSAVADPANGFATTNGTTVTYTPDPDYNGSDTFGYEITDANGGIATASVTVTIDPVNDAPEAGNDVATTAEETAINIAVLANDTDVDGTVSLVSVGSAGHGTVVKEIDGTVTYTPALNYVGDDQFTYTVTDGSLTANAAVYITVTNINDAPDAVDDSAATDEDIALDIDVLANDIDIDGDELSLSLASMPAHGSAVVNPDNSIKYTPSADYNGPDSFTYTVTDGTLNDTATVSVTVNSVNDAPTANTDSATTNEDTDVTISVLANDSDIDGGTLSITSVGSASNGSATDNGDGTVNYSPSAEFNGTDSFTYSISDGQGGSAAATVNITVNPVNDAPVAVDDTMTTDEDTTVMIDVTGNDNDVDGDPLTIDSVTQPLNGSGIVTIVDNQIEYDPDGIYNGNDSFTYIIKDTGGLTDTATVSLTITAFNDPPVAVDDSATTPEDTPVSIDVLSNDTDIDTPSEELTIAIVSNPANGAIVIEPDNTVTYTPGDDFNGSDSFTYKASDGEKTSDIATVSITVTAVNDAPVAADDTASTNEDIAITIDVLGNDTDVDGPSLSVAVGSVTSASNGTAVDNGDGTITYTPNANYHGSDSFSYTVTDGTLTDTASVSITVNSVNDDPTAVNDSAATDEDTDITISVLANDSDVDGGTLSITSVTAASNGTATDNENGTITYSPASNFSGTDSFTYSISDGQGGSATATVNITIDAVNDAPVAADDSATTPEDTAVSIDVITGSDTDVDGDTLEISSLVAQPENGTAAVQEDKKTILYTPGADYNGTDTFSYIVTDGLLTDTATVSITVSAVNDDPVAVNDSTATPEDTAVNIVVLGNDSDADTGDTLTITTISEPANGTAALNADKSIKYTPKNNYNGQDSFTYTIEDTAGATATATVSVTVNAVNDPPVADDQVVDTQEDTPVDITLTGSDIDGDALTYTLVQGPTKGTLLGTAPDLTYTPANGTTGQDQFTFKVNDNTVDSSPATVTINIAADDPDYLDFVATGETAVEGIVTGSVADTTANGDDALQEIQEVESGNKNFTWAGLEHIWIFDVSTGTSITFNVQAWHSGTEPFTFAYSTNGIDYVDMLTVTRVIDEDIYDTAQLPETLSGTVYIRVIDTDTSKDETAVDTIFVDHMFIRSTIPSPKAVSPAPGDGAINVPLDTLLSWVAGTGADSHDLYFGTNPVPGAAEFKINQAETTYNPGTLTSGTTYYWVIDERDDQGNLLASGQVWSFTTATPCEPESCYIASMVLDTIDGSKGQKFGRATITIHNDCGLPVVGAAVSGYFTGDFFVPDQILSSETNSEGTAVIISTIEVKKPAFEFTVSGVTADNLTYIP